MHIILFPTIQNYRVILEVLSVNAVQNVTVIVIVHQDDQPVSMAFVRAHVLELAV